MPFGISTGTHLAGANLRSGLGRVLNGGEVDALLVEGLPGNNNTGQTPHLEALKQL